jgi:predicted acetyltransferase
VYEAARRRTVGFLSRSNDWWELRQFEDGPERRASAGGPLNRALLEQDGRPVGYALYRVPLDGAPGERTPRVRVVEAIGRDPAATRDVWRFLLQIDWVEEIRATYLPAGHPLELMVDRVSKLGLELTDGLWLRLVDVPAALAARSFAGPATVEVASDPLFPDNVGTWEVGDGGVKRSRRRPDVRLDVQALASAYLGGFSFAALAAAGRAAEIARGGLARADTAFRTPTAPWCPENF